MDFIRKHGIDNVTDLDMCLFSVQYDEEENGLYHPETLNSLIELG